MFDAFLGTGFKRVWWDPLFSSFSNV